MNITLQRTTLSNNGAWSLIMVILSSCLAMCHSFSIISHPKAACRSLPAFVKPYQTTCLFMSDDWSNFSALGDDDLDELSIDTTDYAVEDDSQEAKAQVGAALEPPTIENDAPPIEVPAGKS